MMRSEYFDLLNMLAFLYKKTRSACVCGTVGYIFGRVSALILAVHGFSDLDDSSLVLRAVSVLTHDQSVSVMEEDQGCFIRTGAIRSEDFIERLDAIRIHCGALGSQDSFVPEA